MALSNSEEKNYAEIERLERLLADLRASASTARETEAIREIGLEVALAIREGRRDARERRLGAVVFGDRTRRELAKIGA